MWNFRKSFTRNYKEKYDQKRKERQGSNQKNCLPEEALKEKSPKDMGVHESVDCSKGVLGVAKVACSLEILYYGRIFLTEFGGTFFCQHFSCCLFLLGQEENTLWKHTTENQAMKIQVKPGEIPVCKNVRIIMLNVDSGRLAPKSAKLTCYPIHKIQSYIHG